MLSIRDFFARNLKNVPIPNFWTVVSRNHMSLRVRLNLDLFQMIQSHAVSIKCMCKQGPKCFVIWSLKPHTEVVALKENSGAIHTDTWASYWYFTKKNNSKCIEGGNVCHLFHTWFQFCLFVYFFLICQHAVTHWRSEWRVFTKSETLPSKSEHKWSQWMHLGHITSSYLSWLTTCDWITLDWS